MPAVTAMPSLRANPSSCMCWRRASRRGAGCDRTCLRKSGKSPRHRRDVVDRSCGLARLRPDDDPRRHRPVQPRQRRHARLHRGLKLASHFAVSPEPPRWFVEGRKDDGPLCGACTVKTSGLVRTNQRYVSKTVAVSARKWTFGVGAVRVACRQLVDGGPRSLQESRLCGRRDHPGAAHRWHYWQRTLPQHGRESALSVERFLRANGSIS
jgi:hypothetical protein